MTTVQPPQTPVLAYDPRTPRRTGAGWFISGILVLLTAVTLLITGTVVQVIDDSWRRDGYLTSSQIPISATGHAIATERLDLEDIAPLWPDVGWLLGDVRLRATGADGKPVFIGIAPADDAAAYLRGVGHSTLTELADPATAYAEQPGGAPAGKPAEQSFWAARATGSGVQAVEWPPTEGRWAVVVMNADGSPGVDATIDIGITAPVQDWAARVLLVAGGFIAVLGLLLIIVGFRRRTPAVRR